MLEQPPIPVYSADSAQKGQKLFKLYQSVFVLSILTHRSIRCASQNTETVIQMFQQPTAAFISESSQRLTKRMNFCFIVLCSATD